MVISDLEGYKIPPFEGKLIITGDLIDSTISPVDSLDFQKYKDFKSNNLKNIHRVISDDNIDFILGNRDINKIKCAILCKLKGSSDIINQFNNGNINLNIASYNELRQSIEWMEDMRDWYPFWNMNMFKDDKKMLSYWQQLPVTENKFLDRFNHIFGRDGVIGTISADNLLSAIPHELNIDGTDDFKAFIVLSIFNSMLCKIESIISHTSVASYSSVTQTLTYGHGNAIYYTKPQDWDKLDKTNSSFARGWLYCLYMKSNVIKLIESDTKLLLFSHGGITKELAMVDNITDIFTEFEKLYQNNGDMFSARGGGLFESSENIPCVKLRSLCSKYNSLFKQYIINFLTDPFNNKSKLFVLIILSAPFDADEYKKNKGKEFDFKYNKSMLYSPILPGILNLRKSYFVSDKALYQIIGHVPNGYAPSCDVIIGGKESYVINLDTSNSYYSSNSFTPSETSINNFGRLLINNSNIMVLSHISLNDKIDISKDESFTETELNINMDLNQMIENIKELKLTKEYFYHGCVTFNGIIYDIHTENLSGPGFKKKLHIHTRESNMASKMKYYKYKTKYVKLNKLI